MKELTPRSIFWAVLSALCVFAILAVAATFVVREVVIHRAAAHEREIERLETERELAVSDSFKASAAEAGNAVRKEYRAAETGKAAFESAVTQAKNSVDSLESSAASRHEREIAIHLERLRSTFTLCVNDALDPTFRDGTVDQCEKRLPASGIEEALAR